MMTRKVYDFITTSLFMSGNLLSKDKTKDLTVERRNFKSMESRKKQIGPVRNTFFMELFF